MSYDLYQARMLIGYYKTNQQHINGVMEAFTRNLPNCRNFLVVAGIDRIIDFLANKKISDEEIDFLKAALPDVEFSSDLIAYLKGLDFSKDIEFWSMREGEIAFANEPIVQLKGPIGMIQFVETEILSILNHDIKIASKAARVVLAAKNKPIMEFGSRRTHEYASIDAARAAYIAGCSSTSNVAAFAKYGIPTSGTMGHLWVMSHLSGERAAFSNWNEHFPFSTYLIDTYDPKTGLDNAIDCAKNKLGGIRLDSGDLFEQSIAFKRELINRDQINTKIIASNDLNEYKIKNLLEKNAQIDAFGVGTEIVVSPDAPTCGFVYKLSAVENGGKWHKVAKKSKSKNTLAGRKQVLRYHNNHYIFTHDVICDFDHNVQNNGEYTELLIKHDLVGIKDREHHLNRANKARAYRECILDKMPQYLKLIKEKYLATERYPIEINL